MPSQYLHSGEPLPLAPPLEAGADDSNVNELNVFHQKLLDYLRRLTAKLSADVFEPPDVEPPTVGDMVEVLMLTLSADFALASDPDVIEWDEVHRIDDAFLYNSSTGIITCVDAGFYLMFQDYYIPGVANHRSEVKNHSTGARLPYANSYYNQGISSVWSEGHIIPWLVTAADAPQTIRIEIVGGGSSETVEAIASRLVILKIGGVDATIDPCDFDVWQLCP